ncbi:Protein SUPPRESSOR OF PHYA-105 [Musa troglodytarum]|uniref:Protein SUPPRESSOR OF PHYA-105 n=1 Tax=Musa troglodytarum TaxID=320322 RepID=A0A9E7JF32_9LILI|nr:Protein SUPPRESSOR OF PHYA-105 [Musa troglodytarum]
MEEGEEVEVEAEEAESEEEERDEDGEEEREEKRTVDEEMEETKEEEAPIWRRGIAHLASFVGIAEPIHRPLHPSQIEAIVRVGSGPSGNTDSLMGLRPLHAIQELYPSSGSSATRPRPSSSGGEAGEGMRQDAATTPYMSYRGRRDDGVELFRGQTGVGGIRSGEGAFTVGSGIQKKWASIDETLKREESEVTRTRRALSAACIVLDAPEGWRGSRGQASFPLRQVPLCRESSSSCWRRSGANWLTTFLTGRT